MSGRVFGRGRGEGKGQRGTYTDVLETSTSPHHPINQYIPHDATHDDDRDSITLYNLPYATAIATVGSETNLLRVGARGGQSIDGLV